MSSPWWSVLAFLALAPGLGLLAVRRLRLAPADRAMLALLGGIVLLGLGGEVLHLLDAPAVAWRTSLPVLAVLGWISGRREVAAWAGDPSARAMLRGWMVVTTGSLLALAVVRTYSGGDWIGDWVGHYHRVRYFLHQDAAEAWIFQFDPFAARPPLLNLATAALLAQVGDTFASYQIFTTLLGSAATLPLVRLAALAGGGRRAAAWLPLVLLVHPLWMQNATYSWTKLGCAAFVLAGGYLSWRAARGRRPLHWRLAAVLLTAGVLAHYSAAPYALGFAVLYGAVELGRARRPDAWRQAGIVALAAGGLAATWFGWAVAREGVGASLGAQTTTIHQAQELSGSGQARAFAFNLWHTVLPPPWPAADLEFLRHGDPWATVRDFAFAFYQTSLPGMCGLGGLIVLLRVLAGPHAAVRRRLPLVAWGLVFVAVAVAVHPAPMRWGAGHICLQPLALALTALAVAMAPRLSRGVRLAALGGWTIDAVLGVGLHLGLERIEVSPAVLALGDGAPLRAAYGLALANNAAAKHALGLELLGDRGSLGAILPAAAVLLLVAFLPLRQGRS